MKGKNIVPAIVFLVSVLLCAAASVQAAPAFYTDDPVQTEPNSQNAAAVQPWEIDLVYDLVENMFTRPGDKAANARARDINTIDEVPDSEWFVNRAGSRPMTVEDVVKGPDTTGGPAAGPWTVISAKNDGVTPGFTIRDTAQNVWFIKFDPPGYRCMATGTEVVVSKLMWALGYHVPEYHIARLERKNLTIEEGTKVKTPSGKKRAMKVSDIDGMLRKVQRDPDGSYRVIASIQLPGKPLGGFRFYGTRPDDPNDVIPHEHRRSLRGYGVFAAWFNHVDSKAINSLDTLITENGKSYVRHHLLDFGSTLGSGALYPREAWEGYEYLYEGGGPIGKDMVTAGLRVEPWRTLPMYKSRSIGRLTLDNTKWDPDGWVPRVPNAAFLRARDDDRFWAARKAMAITDDMIRAVVKAGKFGDTASEDFLARALIDRRNAIGRKYLTAINPVIDPALDPGGTLTFGNAAVNAGFARAPDGYQVNWYTFDNANGQSQSLGGGVSGSNSVKTPAALPSDAGAFVKIEISATHKDYPSWKAPVTVYFKKTDAGWKLVGLER